MPPKKTNLHKLRKQFQELPRLLESIEKNVLAIGRMEKHEVDLVMSTHKLSSLGREVFLAFLSQSERVVWRNDNGVEYLIRNPELPSDEDTQPDIQVEETTEVDLVLPRTTTDRL